MKIKYQESIEYKQAFKLVKRHHCEGKGLIESKTIAVVDIGCVSLSNVIVLSQHSKIFAVDIS